MIIKNNIIPFGGYKVINLFGLIFTKSDLTDEDKNHENIHSVQILECAIAFAILISILFGLEWVWLAIPSFYIWYGLEYLIIRLLRLKDSQNDCYRDVSFEEEAYMNEDNVQYLEGQRKMFSWIKYLKVNA